MARTLESATGYALASRLVEAISVLWGTRADHTQFPHLLGRAPGRLGWPWSGWLWKQGRLAPLPFLPSFVEFDIVGGNLGIGHEFCVAMLAENRTPLLSERCLCGLPVPRGECSLGRLFQGLRHQSFYVLLVHIY